MPLDIFPREDIMALCRENKTCQDPAFWRLLMTSLIDTDVKIDVTPNDYFLLRDIMKIKISDDIITKNIRKYYTEEEIDHYLSFARYALEDAKKEEIKAWIMKEPMRYWLEDPDNYPPTTSNVIIRARTGLGALARYSEFAKEWYKNGFIKLVVFLDQSEITEYSDVLDSIRGIVDGGKTGSPLLRPYNLI